MKLHDQVQECIDALEGLKFRLKKGERTPSITIDISKVVMALSEISGAILEEEPPHK